MSDKKSVDTIFAKPLEEIVDFVFDENIVDVFPDMINRSVPGYSTIINLVGIIAEKYSQPGTHLYDLGCSLGASTLSIRHRLTKDECKIIAVDNAQPMIDRFNKILLRDTSKTKVVPVCQDIAETEIENASFVAMNFTLQFIEPERRGEIIQKIYNGLNPGGCLVVSEKLAFDNQEENQSQVDLHHSFKKTNGYSDLEIAQKRSALENVLIPETVETHLQRFHQAGFRQVYRWFQCFNFASFIAVKD